MQAYVDAALRRQREQHGAASSTVEALMFELRTLGVAALAGGNCQRRLAELSPRRGGKSSCASTVYGPPIPRLQTTFCCCWGS
jgi:hypothetical protein